MREIIIDRALLKQQRNDLLNGKLDETNTKALFDFLVEIDMLTERSEPVRFMASRKIRTW